MNQLGEKLKTLREQRGMKQAQLANAVDVQPSRISQWETGARGVPLEVLVKLASALSVSVEELLSSTVNPETEKVAAL